MASQIKTKFYKDHPKTRICQGDIFKDVVIISFAGINEVNGESLFSKINLPYAIIISQECDLEHDFNYRQQVESNTDKHLSNILLLPAYLQTPFKDGTHLGGDKIGAKWNGDLWKNIQKNGDARFHIIKENAEFQVPALIIDFKQVYTIKREYIYGKMNESYLVTISELFRENLSHRYTHYLSRIGLPEIN